MRVQNERHKGELEKKEQLFQKIFGAKSGLEKQLKTKEAEVAQVKKDVESLK